MDKKLQNGQKTFRLVDYSRKLNEATIQEVFKIPRIDDILNQLGNSPCLTTLDQASGYQHVLVDEKDKAKLHLALTGGL